MDSETTTVEQAGLKEIFYRVGREEKVSEYWLERLWNSKYRDLSWVKDYHRFERAIRNSFKFLIELYPEEVKRSDA